MSRHRHVRNLDVDDYEHHDHAEEEEEETDFAAANFSPTSQQYIYNRGRAPPSLAAWAGGEAALPPPAAAAAAPAHGPPPGFGSANDAAAAAAAAAPAGGGGQRVKGYEADYEDAGYGAYYDEEDDGFYDDGGDYGGYGDYSVGGGGGGGGGARGGLPIAKASDKKSKKKKKKKKAQQEAAAAAAAAPAAPLPRRTAAPPDASLLAPRKAGAGAAAATPSPGRTPKASPGASPRSGGTSSPAAGKAPALVRSESSTMRDAAAFSSRREAERRRVVEAELKGERKARINMVCIGHVDAGKSTLMGHLLLQTGRVDQRTVRKFEKESRDAGKASFHFAWVMDQHEEERSRGVTVDVAVNHFETPNRVVTMLDAPGHRDFIPNMISGAAQADAAVLVVPAVRGEFESGFAAGGQTKEHAILAKSLGVSQLIVAVNKLDAAGWDRARYESIVEELTPFLRQAGFRDGSVRAVPVSGLTGENIKERHEAALSAWYQGPTLLELVDGFKPPERAVERPFRFCVSDVFRSQNLGLTVAGRVEAGSVMPKDRLLLLPSREVCTVKAVEDRGVAVAAGLAGQNLEVGLRDLSTDESVSVGTYLCDPRDPIPLVTRFRAQIVTTDLELPLLKGSQLELFTQSVHEPATLTKLVSLLDKASGEVKRKRPRHLTKNSSAVVEITPGRAVCLELYRDYRQLGRFSLRRAGHTVAVGIVTEIKEQL